MTADACRRALLATLVTLAGGCSPGTTPTVPTPVTAVYPTPPPAAPQCSGNPPFVPTPVTEPARIYLDTTSCPEPSRYVLYDDGRFMLQYSSFSAGFRGTYKEDHGTVIFNWEAWSSAGPWGATGVLTEDTLEVKYNLVMQLTDFVDAVYTRVR